MDRPEEADGQPETRLACLDVEASSLWGNSYPIEVGIAFVGSDRTEAWLIRPTEDWLNIGQWDPRSEVVHGIPKAMLLEEGLSVEQVAEEVAAALSGWTVFSDAPEYDAAWLGELYAAVGWAAPFGLRSIWSFYERIAGPLEVKLAQKMARDRFPTMHRAVPDAARLAETLRILLGLP